MNYKNLTGGKLLGSGGYGSVFSPRLPLIKNPKDDYTVEFNNEVVKLFKTGLKSSFDEEIAGYMSFIFFLSGSYEFLNSNNIIQRDISIKYFMFPLDYGK
jgi:hypothetical protein